MESTSSSSPPLAPRHHTGHATHTATDSSGGGARATDDRSGVDKAAAARAQYDERVSQLDTETALRKQFLDQSFAWLNEYFGDEASISHLLSTNETLFAHIHLDSIVKKTRYEGLNPLSSLEYFINLIQLAPVQESLANGGEGFFDKLKDLLSKCLETAFKLADHIVRNDTEGLNSEINTIVGQINDLPPGESYLLLGGYSRQVSHCIYYEFKRQTNGEYTLYVYNTQNRKDLAHTVSTTEKTKIKPYIKFENIKSEILFLSDKKEVPDSLMIRQLISISDSKVLLKKPTDLEDILLALIPINHCRVLDDGHDIYMTPQRSGTCSWRSLKGFIYTYSIQHGQVPVVEAADGAAQAMAQTSQDPANNQGRAVYKALITFAKAYSLIWLQNKPDKQTDEKIQLLHATRMFADRIEKHLAQEQHAPKSTLLNDELLKGFHALIHTIQTTKSSPVERHMQDPTTIEIPEMQEALNQFTSSFAPGAWPHIVPKNIEPLHISHDPSYPLFTHLEELHNWIEKNLDDIMRSSRQEKLIIVSQIEDFTRLLPLPELGNTEPLDWCEGQAPVQLFNYFYTLHSTYFKLVRNDDMTTPAAKIFTLQTLHLLCFKQTQLVDTPLGKLYRESRPSLNVNGFLQLINKPYFIIDTPEILQQYNRLRVYCKKANQDGIDTLFETSIRMNVPSQYYENRIEYKILEALGHNVAPQAIIEYWKTITSESIVRHQTFARFLHFITHPSDPVYNLENSFIDKLQKMAVITDICLPPSIVDIRDYQNLSETDQIYYFPSQTQGTKALQNLPPVVNFSIVFLGSKIERAKGYIIPNKEKTLQDSNHNASLVLGLPYDSSCENRSLVKQNYQFRHLKLQKLRALMESREVLFDSLCYFLLNNPDFLKTEEYRVIVDNLLFKPCSGHEHIPELDLSIFKAARDKASFLHPEGRLKQIKQIIKNALKPYLSVLEELPDQAGSITRISSPKDSKQLAFCLYHICIAHKMSLCFSSVQENLGLNDAGVDESKGGEPLETKSPDFEIFEGDFDLKIMLAWLENPKFSDKDKATLHFHILSHYMQKKEHNPKDWPQIFTSWFKLREALCLPGKPLDITLHQIYTDKLHLLKVENWINRLIYRHLQDPCREFCPTKELHATLVKLCKTYSIDISSDIFIVNDSTNGIYPVQIGQLIYHFNFTRGRIDTQDKAIQKTSIPQKIRDVYRKLFECRSHEIFGDENECSFIDQVYGSISVSHTNEQNTFYIFRDKPESDKKLRFIDLASFKHPALPEILKTDYTHWYDKKTNIIHFTDPKTGIDKGTYNLGQNKFYWNERESLTIGLQQGLANRFKQLDDPIFWVCPDDLQIKIIDFKRLGVTLIEKDGKYYLQENKHFYLCDPEENAPFDEMFGAYWFKHIKHKDTYKVIFASKEKKNTQESFDPAHVKNDQIPYNKDQSNTKSIDTFEYHYSTENKKLESNSPQGTLYLSYLSMVKRDYLQAHKHLLEAYKQQLRSKATEATNKQLIKIFTFFFERYRADCNYPPDDESPNATALRLKMYCLFKNIKVVSKYFQEIEMNPTDFSDFYLSSKRNVYGLLKLTTKMEKEVLKKRALASVEPMRSFIFTSNSLEITQKILQQLALLIDTSIPVDVKLALLYKQLMTSYKVNGWFSLNSLDYIYFMAFLDLKEGISILKKLSQHHYLLHIPRGAKNQTLPDKDLLNTHISSTCKRFGLQFCNEEELKSNMTDLALMSVSLTRMIEASFSGKFFEGTEQQKCLDQTTDYPKSLALRANDTLDRQDRAIDLLEQNQRKMLKIVQEKTAYLGSLPSRIDTATYSDTLKSLQGNCTTLASFILKLMNKPPQEHTELVHFQVPRVALGTPGPDLKTILFYSSLKKGDNLLKSLNPNLTDQEIIQVIHASHLFMLDHIESKRLEQLIELESTCSELAASQEHPSRKKIEELRSLQTVHDGSDAELIYFEYINGFRIRQEQFDIIQNVTAKLDTGESNCFQLLMGGGKTSVIMSLLVSKIAKQKNKIALFLCHHSQYDSVVGNLSKFQDERFGHETYRLNYTRDELDLTKLQEIESIFKTAKNGQDDPKNPISIIMPTHLLQTLELEYRTLIITSVGRAQEEIAPKLQILRSILIMLKDNTVAFLDEVDLNLDIMNAVVFPKGERKSLTSDQIHLTKLIFQLIVGNETLENLAMLSLNRQDELNQLQYEKEFVPLLVSLLIANWPVEYEIPDEQKEGLNAYLNPKSDVRPDFHEWLRELKCSGPNDSKKETLADLITLAKGLFEEILPATFSKSCNRSYGRSQTCPGKICPYLGVNTPASTEFGHPVEAMCFHFLTTICTHLSADDMTVVAQQYSILASNYSNLQATLFEETIEAREFKKLTGISLSEVFIGENLKLAMQEINSDPKKRLEFESILVYTHATYHQECLSNTPIDLTNLLNQVVACSGTPWNIDSYTPTLQQEPQLDTSIKPRIIEKLMQDVVAKESRVLITKSASIESMFNTYDDQKEKLEELKAIVDVGGLLKEHSNYQIAQQILYVIEVKQIEQLEGVLFFCSENKQFAILRRSDNKLLLIDNTSRDEVEKFGISIDNLFVYFDELRATGTDIALSVNARIFLTIDPHKVLLRNILQGTLRARGFFDQQHMDMMLVESSIFHVQPKRSQSPTQEIDQAALVGAILDRAEENEQAAILEHTGRSFQEQINSLFKHEIQKYLLETNDVADEIKLKFKTILRENSDFDPYLAFAAPQHPQETLVLLQRLFEKKLECFEKILKGPGQEVEGMEFVDILAENITESFRHCLANAERKIKEGSLSIKSIHSHNFQQVEVQTETKAQAQVETEVKTLIQREYDSYQLTHCYDCKVTPFTNPEIETLLSFNSFDEIDTRKIKLIERSLDSPGTYQKPYWVCFKDSRVYMSENYRNITISDLTIFDKKHSFKNPAFILLKKTNNGTFETLILSEYDASCFQDYFQRGGRISEQVWLIFPNGTVQNGDCEAFSKVSLDVLLLEQLWYINFFLGNVSFLTSDKMLEWTKIKITQSEIKEIFVAFLQLKNMDHSKHKHLLSNHPYFAGINAYDGFYTKARKAYELTLCQELAQKDPNEMTEYEMKYMNPVKVNELTDENLFKVQEARLISAISREKVNLICPEAVQYLNIGMIKHLTDEGLLSRVLAQHVKEIPIERRSIAHWQAHIGESDDLDDESTLFLQGRADFMNAFDRSTRLKILKKPLLNLLDKSKLCDLSDIQVGFLETEKILELPDQMLKKINADQVQALEGKYRRDEDIIKRIAPNLGQNIQYLSQPMWTGCFSSPDHILKLAPLHRTPIQWQILIEESPNQIVQITDPDLLNRVLTLENIQHISDEQVEHVHATKVNDLPIEKLHLLTQEQVVELERQEDDEFIQGRACQLEEAISMLSNRKWIDCLRTPYYIHYVKNELKSIKQWETLINANELNVTEVAFLKHNSGIINRMDRATRQNLDHPELINLLNDESLVDITAQQVELLNEANRAKLTTPEQIQQIDHNDKTDLQWETLINANELNVAGVTFLQHHSGIINRMNRATRQNLAHRELINLLNDENLADITAKQVALLNEANRAKLTTPEQIHEIEHNDKTNFQWETLVDSVDLKPDEITFLQNSNTIFAQINPNLVPKIPNDLIPSLPYSKYKFIDPKNQFSGLATKQKIIYTITTVAIGILALIANLSLHILNFITLYQINQINHYLGSNSQHVDQFKNLISYFFTPTPAN